MADELFDLRTDIRDGKGKVISHQPYRLMIVNGQERYERPVGSGKWYSRNNQLLADESPRAHVAQEQVMPIASKTASVSKPKAT